MIEYLKTNVIMKLNYRDFTAKLHSHDYYQFIYIVKGRGEIGINDKKYQCEANDALLIKKNECHYIYSKNMTTFEFKFTLENSSLINICDSSDHTVKDNQNIIRGLINSIDNEIEGNNLYRVLYIKSELLKILIVFLRYQNIAKSNNNLNRKLPIEYGNNNVLSAAIKYIENNYSKKISVMELAELFHMEYKYFSKVFNKQFGIGPKQYITMYRLEKAKEMLVNSNDSISIIAEKSGFERIHYLDNIFLKYEGMSPSEFRENVTKMYKLNMENEPAELVSPKMK